MGNYLRQRSIGKLIRNDFDRLDLSQARVHYPERVYDLANVLKPALRDLRELDLSFSADLLTAAEAQALGEGCKRLENLALSGLAVTDECVAKIIVRNAQTLKSLDLSNCTL